MRIVVTGATGNVGSALLRALAGRTDVEVVGLARRTPTATTNDRLSWVGADLTDDACRPVLREAFTGADAVVHLAWGFQPSHRPDRLRELGVGGTGRVLDAAAETTVPHLVHMSSVGAYSPKVDDLLVDEGHPTGGIPGSVYSRHKSEVERLLDRHEAGVDAVPAVARLRPGIVGQRAAGSALLRYGLPGSSRHAPSHCSRCSRSTGGCGSRWCTPTTSPTPSCGCSTAVRPARSTSPQSRC